MCLRVFWDCWTEKFTRKSKSYCEIVSAHKLKSSENEFAVIYRKIPALQDLNLD